MVDKLNVSLRKKSFYINYDSNSSPLNTMKNYHLHDDYEIFYLLEGERIYLINRKKYVVKANNLVFIDKNIIHKTKVTDVPNTKRVVINFQDSFLTGNEDMLLNQLFDRGPHIIRIPANKVEIIQTLIKKLLSEYNSNADNTDAYIQTLLIQLLIESTRLLNTQENDFAAEVYDDYFVKHEIAEIIRYIRSHYNQDISLSLLSNRFNLSEQYISRLFRKVTGVTLINYLNAVRINQAKRLLLETSLKVTDVSKRVGYSNNVHLWRVFKRFTGHSPNEYRELNKSS